MHQKSGSPERVGRGQGEALLGTGRDEAQLARHAPGGLGREGLLEQALARENLVLAWKRVKANRGSAGVDGLDIRATADHLKTNWPRIRDALLDRSYRPGPVRRVEIPKSGGGKRMLGIPTVTDRLIQQALLQVLQPLIAPTFSEHSYGFRPGRRAHDAVVSAQRYAQAGYRVVVDVDLERFFDRVNHDVLMDRLAKRVADKAVLRLIRRYLGAGIMAHGVVMERYEGTPQGARSHRCWPTYCWMRWIGRWSNAATVLSDTRTTATCMYAVGDRASGYWLGYVSNMPGYISR